MLIIQKAAISDAKKLTEIMKRTFDEEANRWILNQEIIDYNIQPPGNSSIEMTKYMIEELDSFKILSNHEIVGGIIVTIAGKRFGRINRIFLHPEYQGKKIGSSVIELIEQEFPDVMIWDLETSSRQVNNHYFYEKMGYRTVHETEDEYCYSKRKGSLGGENVVDNKDISSMQYVNDNMEKNEFYQVSLEGSAYSNSNLMNIHISNCNLHQAKFQNINFQHSLYADLNLSYSKMRLVTLAGVQFLDTNLGENNEPIVFERCDLQGTKIHNNNLRNLQISDSDITGMTIDNIPVDTLLEVYEQTIKKRDNS